MKRFIIHPVFFALYPVLALQFRNTEQILFREVLSSLMLALIFLVIVWALMYLSLKSWAKSAIAASVFMVMFFSYGHLINLLTVAVFSYRIKELAWAGNLVTTNLGLFLVLFAWTVIYLLVYLLARKSKSDLKIVTSFFNIVSIIAFVILIGWNGLIQLLGGRSTSPEFVEDWGHYLSQECSSNPVAAPNDLPDIYYIILDGYGRSDILDQLYQLDNSEFITFLREQGFYVAEQSRTNYPYTIFSLSSSLNFFYLDKLPEQVKQAPVNTLNLREMLQDNCLMRILKTKGYLTINIPTGFTFTEANQADINLIPAWHINGFQNELLNATPIPLLLDLSFLPDQNDLHRQRILYAFDHLDDYAQGEQPFYALIHILAPHPPFVFDEKGGPVNIGPYFSLIDDVQPVGGPEGYKIGYQKQLSYINLLVQEKIKEILAKSTRRPIIIIQADHGPAMMFNMQDKENQQDIGLFERFSILNAYYFPDQDYRHLYTGISPVNAFRVILNQYFGYNYNLLQDRNYLVSNKIPYSFIDVTDRLDQVKTK
jgi:hypothetical protein